MGTSASSKGPGAGVSFDPPWLDDIDVPGQDNQISRSRNCSESEVWKCEKKHGRICPFR